jgi:Deacetylase PdaC/Protein of unknown function (DUF3298)
MLTRFAPAALLLFATSVCAATPQITHYIGTINGDTPIALTLDSGSFDKITGAYLSTQHGKIRYLAGTRSYAASPQTDFSLAEASSDDKTAGRFALASGQNGVLTGTWKTADGQKNYPVTLTPCAKTVTLLNAQSDRYEVQTGYLQFPDPLPFHAALNAQLQKTAGALHNQQVAQLLTDTADFAQGGETTASFPWSIEQTQFLLFASDTLVSLRVCRYEFTGGAHGNTSYAAENYAWINGHLVPLTLGDLLAPTAWGELRDLCVQDLKAQHASWPEEIKLDPDHPPTLNFTAQGLFITFAAYEAGPYVEGEYVVCLPYTAVQAFIPNTSPLKPLLPK